MKNILRTLLLLVISISLNNSLFSQIQVISPNGGETWVDGTPALISFNNSGPEDYFIISFSDDNGATWIELDYTYGYQGLNELYSYGSFQATSEAKIRVANYSVPAINDESDLPFTVVIPAYYIYSPMPGDIYYQGSEIYVQWYSENTNPVNIEFSSDNGTTWSSIGTGVTNYYFSFFAPEVVSDQCVIRLSDASDPLVNVTSGAFSIITPPSITVVTPNGGEVWSYGQDYTVTWTGENLDYYVVVEFSPDGGTSWQQLTYAETSATGGTAQVPAPMYPTTNAKIRVSDYYYQNANDVSDASFTVNSPAYMVYSPYANSAFYTTDQIIVQWTSFLSLNTDIQLSVDGGVTFQTVASNLPSYQQYAYIDAPDSPTENCVLKVVANGNPDFFGLSESFRIVPLPELTLTFPAGGEILDNDSTYNITWNLSGELLYYVSGIIEISQDNGNTWQNVGWIYDMQMQTSFEWKTPLQTSDQCLLRIYDYYNSSVMAVSSSTFAIKDFPTLDICMVSVDSISGKNIIIWNKSQSELINEYVVLKETNEANVYAEVGSVTANAVSMITDENSNPTEKATRYKLTFRDQFGNQYAESSLHQTIHLSINKGVGNTWNLYWNPYLGFEVSSYNIYRGTSPDGLQMIGTVSGNFTSYSDLNAGSEFVYYMVEVLNPNNCNPERSGSYSSSRSNIATNNSVGLFEKNSLANLTVYPNPATDIIKLKSTESISGNVTVKITSSYGKLIQQFGLNGYDLNNGQEINVKNLSSGIYTIMVIGDNYSGTTKLVIK